MRILTGTVWIIIRIRILNPENLYTGPNPKILRTDPRKKIIKNPISIFPQKIQHFKTKQNFTKIYVCLNLIKERKEIITIKRKL